MNSVDEDIEYNKCESWLIDYEEDCCYNYCIWLDSHVSAIKKLFSGI